MVAKLALLLAWVFLPVLVFAQQAPVFGTVTDDTGIPLQFASIIIKGRSSGTQSDAAGKFKLIIPSDKDITLQVTYVGFQEQQVQVRIKAAESKEIKIILIQNDTSLSTVVISGQSTNSKQQAVSIMRINPRISKEIPSVFNDFNKVLATLPGVISNNELSSTYSVRGGNYDENLVYVNGIEIYRPFLVSNAQQEGLSFVNPDLVQDIQFSSGGWQPQFGDKLSSVLNITYKTPEKFAGSVTGSLMGGGVHVEAASKNKRITYLAGVRYKNARLVFNSLQTNGNYQPNFTDAQTYITFDLTDKARAKDDVPKTTLGVLASVAHNKYEVVPFYRETSFGTTDRIVHVGIRYNGHERMEYETYQSGLNLSHQFNKSLSTEVIASAVLSRERELRDVAGTYSFLDVLPDVKSRSPNENVRNIDAGTAFDHSRNTLSAQIYSLENRYTWQPATRHTIQAGIKASHEVISDKVQEYSLTDSADYIVSHQQLASDLNLKSYRYQGYGQHTIRIDSMRTITYGARVSYWSVNRELLLSPRVQYAAVLPENPNWTYKIALGYYYQPPFYRELRDREGVLNKDLKAQKSIHLIAGIEHRFLRWSRPFKLTTEAYYKKLDHVIPYEVDNVRLRYFARNNARAYAAGFDVRVNGEFIKGAESWFSLGVLTTKENISGDSTTIDFHTFKRIQKQPISYIRRPTDQRVTLGIFFQDHLPNNPTFKMYLNGIIGTGLPFSPPGNESIRNQFHMPVYKRVDIGFSKLLSFRDSELNKKSYLESIWISLEVLNLIAANNVVSYSYIKDIHNVTYAVPNYLSSRLVNLRFIARF